MVTKSGELPAVVISGLPASGKSTLANLLSKDLGLPIYSMGQRWREEHRRLHPNGDISFEEFWRATSIEDNRKINIEMKDVFESGTYIVDTRYSSYLDSRKCLKIFVTADLATRADRALEGRPDYKGKSITDVRDILRGREKDELRVGLQIFGVDYREPSLHNIVINSAMLTPEEEFRIVQDLRRIRREGEVDALARSRA